MLKIFNNFITNRPKTQQFQCPKFNCYMKKRMEKIIFDLKMKNVLIATFLLIFSCTTNQNSKSFDIEKATKEILDLHHQQRDVHFQKKAAEFASLLSENHISVNRGVVQTPTIEENTERFQGYFDSVEFIKWDDLQPPVIKFSDDGSLAYTIVEKEVVVKYKDEEEQEIQGTTVFAWVAIYKKYGTEWKIDCVASTNKPSKEELLN